jgi:hypothetical protein
MSNAAICIRWGAPVVGRETKSLEVFNAVLEYNTRLEKDGKIAGHRLYLANNGNLSAFGGFLVTEGEVAQLRAVVDSNEFQMLLVKAQQCVTSIEVTHCVSGSAIGQAVERLMSARKELGITT